MAKLVMIQPHLTQLITRGVLYGIFLQRIKKGFCEVIEFFALTAEKFSLMVRYNHVKFAADPKKAFRFTISKRMLTFQLSKKCPSGDSFSLLRN